VRYIKLDSNTQKVGYFIGIPKDLYEIYPKIRKSWMRIGSEMYLTGNVFDSKKLDSDASKIVGFGSDSWIYAPSLTMLSVKIDRGFSC
jgi:hypothetical protein